MVFKLYGVAFSTCTKRVAIVLHEKNVPFEFHPIDFAAGEHKSPEFLKHQPFGQVPYIEDDGLVLYESRAICRYIAEKYAGQGTPLIPTELKAKAIFEQATSVEKDNFDALASKAVYEKVFKPMYGLTPNQETFDELIGNLDKRLDVYDQILSKQKYVAGEEITLADLFHIPYGAMLAAAGSNILDTKPNVARWWKDITSRSSWIAVEDGVKSTG
ncbi:uncharacterized protein LACBIDRAFT_296671 [Laccaria bicolor S238N-H82]|uniref:glutathione transferase n=1 Tax=Laccaria bicolor (strain S238N-H82 / ATCC MYA-4686) TaxID=486041 RepID=B0D9D9_LACBS|nr:uncharacterized protein LACBIDRAFT_296671 [Laccaria bicolor S238N-H82]EDR09231.1 predicted protein [Laccaria bicolor S238N-H82]|eukprot:XP_001880544.1 predicted protein [Laccaria bicolor S238N-H82]